MKPNPPSAKHGVEPPARFTMRGAMPQVRWLHALPVSLCFSVATALAQSYPAPYPRENASRVFENGRVTVWEVTWPKGQPTVMHEHPFDQLSVTLAGGSDSRRGCG